MVTNRWLYQSQLAIAAEVDSAGNPVRMFNYGSHANVPELMTLADGTQYRLVTDHLGSVRLVIDVAADTVVQRLAYDAYGRVVVDTRPGFQPFGYAGGLYDPLTGLVRFGARDYDAESGRWTAKDPAGLLVGYNRYEYADSRPADAIDPNGEVVIYVHGTRGSPSTTWPADFRGAVNASFGDPIEWNWSWSGAWNHAARAEAARRLADNIHAYRTSHPGEQIIVVAHSHGGNVALMATWCGAQFDQLVTLGTPIWHESRPAPGSIGYWWNVSSSNDVWQLGAAPGVAQRAPTAGAQNLALVGFDHGELHTVAAWNATLHAIKLGHR